jgi:YggT family protein
MIHLLFELIRVVLSLITVVLIVHVVLSWLIAFEVVSRTNAFVGGVFQFTTRVTDPMVRPLRRISPPVGGVDLSILVRVIAVWFASQMTYWLESVLRGGPVL